MNAFLKSRVALAHKLADASGRVIRSYFRKAKIRSATKEDSRSAIVTAADQESEEAIVDLIRKYAPEDGIIREEGEDVPSQNGHFWVLDPIDGTSAFVRGLPTFGTLIGLMRERDGASLLGVLDQPILKERWLGVCGQAATFNGKRIVNPYAKEKIVLKDVCLASTSPLMFATKRQQRIVRKMQSLCKRNAFGGDCYNYAAVASGWTSIPMVALEADLQYYDFCSIIPIIQGAGGVITDWHGGALKKGSSEVLATPNEKIHRQVLDVIGSV